MYHDFNRVTMLILAIVLLLGGLSFAKAETAVSADEAETQRGLFIALDTGMPDDPSKYADAAAIHEKAIALFEPMTVFAAQAGRSVTVINTDPSVSTPTVLFPSSEVNGPSNAQEALRQISFDGIKSPNVQLTKTAEGLLDLIPEKSVGDLYVVSRFNRFAGPLNKNGNFYGEAQAFYDAFSTLLESSPDLTLHLVWFSQKDSDSSFVDEALVSKYGSRVKVDLLDSDVQTDGFIKPAVNLLRQSLGADIAVPQTVSPMAVNSDTAFIPYAHKTDSDVLLHLHFDAGTQLPAQVRFTTAAGMEAFALNAARLPTATAEPDMPPETVSAARVNSTVYFDPVARSAWLYLDGIEKGSYSIQLLYAAPSPEGGDAVQAAQPVSDSAPSLTAYLCGASPEIRLEILPPESDHPENDGIPLAEDGKTLLLTRDELTRLDLYAELPFAAQEDFSASLTLTYSDTPAPGPASTESAGQAQEAALPDAQGDAPEDPAAEQTGADLPPAGNAEPPAEPVLLEGFQRVDPEDGFYHWTLSLPRKYLPAAGSGMTLRADIRLNNESAVLQSNELSVRTVNRPPEVGWNGVVQDEDGVFTLEQNLYTKLPGMSPKTYSLDLNQVFCDPDGDLLEITTPDMNSSSTTINYKCEFDKETNTFTYTPFDQGANELSTPIRFVASDGDKRVELKLTIGQRSLEQILKKLRMTPVDGEYVTIKDTAISGKPGVLNTLRLMLDADSLSKYADYKDAAQLYGLPPLEELITVRATRSEDKPLTCQLQEEQGNLTLTIELGNYPTAEKFEPSFEVTLPGAGPNGEAIQLENLIPTLSVNIENTAPTLIENAPGDPVSVTKGIDGPPWHYAPVSFRNLFDEVDFTSMFNDAETPDSLTYWISVDGSATFDGQPVSGESDFDNAQDILALSFDEPGSASVRVWASDGEHESAAIVYEITLYSTFRRMAILAAVIAAILAVCVVVALLLYRRSLPTFANTVICFYADRTPPQRNMQRISSLNLDSYGKDHVPFMTLMIASAQFLPRSISSQALADIEIVPGKHDAYGIILGNHAESAGLRVFCGHADITGRKKPINASFDQIVSIASERDRIDFAVSRQS